MTFKNWFFIVFIICIFVGGWLANDYFTTEIMREKDSPYDFIKEEDIYLEEGRVCVNIDWGHWASFTDTNSMDPVIDIGTNAIEIKPKSMDDVHVGDIISYKKGDIYVVHRVVEKYKDYVITKGDNNALKDNIKVYLEDITGIVVMIIY